MDDHNPQGPSNDMIHRWTFRDFITPDPRSIVHITGHEATLEALDFALSSDACVQHPTNRDSVYAPILIAVNHVCKTFSPLGYQPITLGDLIDIQRQPWFQTLLEQYAKKHHLPEVIQSAEDAEMTGDFMVVLLEALALTKKTPEMELSVVVLSPGSLPHACHYPPTATQSSIAAWIVVDTRSGDSQLYGIGSSGGQQQQQQGPLNENDQVEDNEAISDNADNDEVDSNDEQPLDAPPTEPRKTAARVLTQQIPLPANLTAADILLHHKDNLQYTNILKVALVYSNQKISEECKAQGKLKQPTAVVKRINTALAWVEREFGISNDAFRTVFDRERKINGIHIRGKDTVVDDTVLAANADKITAAMAWVRAGGPRPATTSTGSGMNAASSIHHSAHNQTSGSTMAPNIPSSSIPGGYTPASPIPHSLHAPSINFRSIDSQLNRVMSDGMNVDIGTEHDESDDFLAGPYDAQRWKALYEDPEGDSSV
jgi:hypothetical protein